jgi:hypothetical protein
MVDSKNRYSPIMWNEIALNVLLVMVLGQVVVIWAPIWFAPPLIKYSYIVYIIFAILWLPILLFYSSKKLRGNPRSVLIIIGISTVVSGWMVLAMGISLLGTPVNNCEEMVSPSSPLVIYHCNFANLGESSSYYTFEGQRGNLFVVRVMGK